MDNTDKQAAKYKSKNLMGFIQDKVDVGMTKLRSDEGVVLDVAILKATIQDEVVPKEKHVRTLKIGCSAAAPRQQVNYVIHGLAKRLEEKKVGWIVTLKTLIVFHRLLREVDPSFQDELIRYQERTGAHRMLRLDGYADHTTKETWDYSAWVRVYSVYLDERLGVFKAMRFDPELETSGGVPPPISPDGFPGAAVPPPPPPPQQGQAPRETKLKSCPAHELLEHLPLVQKLLGRLIACVPEGAAQSNEIVLQSCIMVLRELRAVYRAVCEGIINLADKFFEMERPDALKALDIYRDNIALNEKLNASLSAVNNVPALRGTVQMPALQSLPADFLTTMEEYVKDAPKVMDPSAPQPRAAAGPTGGLRSSTLLRQGGTTSSAITGTSTGAAAGPTGGGVLKIGPPVSDSPAPAAPPPAAAPSIDLLGDDFTAAVAVSSPPPAAPSGGSGAYDPSNPFGALAPPAAGASPAPPPQGQPQPGPYGFPDAQPALARPRRRPPPAPPARRPAAWRRRPGPSTPLARQGSRRPAARRPPAASWARRPMAGRPRLAPSTPLAACPSRRGPQARPTTLSVGPRLLTPAPRGRRTRGQLARPTAALRRPTGDLLARRTVGRRARRTAGPRARPTARRTEGRRMPDQRVRRTPGRRARRRWARGARGRPRARRRGASTWCRARRRPSGRRTRSTPLAWTCLARPTRSPCSSRFAT